MTSFRNDLAEFTSFVDGVGIGESDCLYKWSPLQCGDHPQVRADLLVLHLVTYVEGHGYLYRRMFPAQCKENGIGVLCYSAGNFRVTNGYRRGAIIRPHDKKDKDSVTQAGVVKYLKIGTEFQLLDADNPQDTGLILAALECIGDVAEDAFVRPPPLYMTFREGSVEKTARFKNTDRAVNALTQMVGYDLRKPMEENARDRIEELAYRSQGRVGLPYFMYGGRGVPAFRLDDFSPLWRHAAETQTEHKDEVIIR